MLDLSKDAPKFERHLYDMAAMNPLKAVEHPLDPYSLCWCGSGKKWKFCHKDRARLEPIPYGQRHNRIIAQLRVGKCLHPEASAVNCSESSAIRSHSVQRRGGLAAIAEDGHVLSTKKGFYDVHKTDGMVAPSSIGVRDASTFPGFCGYHDTKLFEPVERPNAVLNDINAFLLSFRTIAYEIAAKFSAQADFERARDESDRGMTFQRQVMVQTLLHYQRMAISSAIERLSYWKDVYARMYMSSDFSLFQFCAIEFESILPFVAAATFLPEYDFSGNRLQPPLNPRSEHLCINVTVLNGKSVAVFGWIREGDGASGQFVASFSSLPDDQKADALLLLLFEYSENVYMRPSWWNSLAPEVMKTLTSKILSGVGVNRRSSSGLLETALGAVVANVAGKIKG